MHACMHACTHSRIRQLSICTFAPPLRPSFSPSCIPLLLLLLPRLLACPQVNMISGVPPWHTLDVMEIMYKVWEGCGRAREGVGGVWTCERGCGRGVEVREEVWEACERGVRQGCISCRAHSFPTLLSHSSSLLLTPPHTSLLSPIPGGGGAAVVPHPLGLPFSPTPPHSSSHLPPLTHPRWRWSSSLPPSPRACLPY
jgi:hypothetical protein